jgi:hypothetical protein
MKALAKEILTDLIQLGLLALVLALLSAALMSF